MGLVGVMVDFMWGWWVLWWTSCGVMVDLEAGGCYGGLGGWWVLWRTLGTCGCYGGLWGHVSVVGLCLLLHVFCMVNIHVCKMVEPVVWTTRKMKQTEY